MIQVTNLTKSYGANTVLDSISATFFSGKVYGIVGENGAGKTTFFKCLAGLEKFSGKVDSQISPLKNHLGWLPTEPYFFEKITGKEYIQLLCNARQIKLTDIATKNIFNLPLNEYASTYSTGMKKKLALTALLFQNNDYFILDEPFNGVDIQSNMIITELIHKLKTLNKTVLISSHIFSTIKDNCDEVFVMRKGQMIKQIEKQEFDALEQEMKELTIGSTIEKLHLQ